MEVSIEDAGRSYRVINRPECQTANKNQEEVKGRSRDTLFLAASKTQA
ncbi:hypothetical protein [Microcoleus sp. CAWBG58]|nr:hypothetical protein [Microcoleus sp. CAWBG58]